MANGLPKDPMLLLSVVNTKLRDYYHDLDALCDDLDVEKEEIVNTLNDMSSVLSEYIEKEKVEKVISYQVDKVTKENHRYADIVVEKYGKNFVEDGLKHLIHDND